MPKSIYIWLIIILPIIACKKENLCDCLKGTGNNTEEIRILPAFNHILIDDEITLYVNPNSTEHSAQVKAGEKIIDLIKTDVSDSMLYITNNNKCNWVRSLDRQIEIIVNTKDLNHLEVEGSATVNFLDTLETDYFKCDIRKASGSVNLLLNCKEVFLGSHSGVADLTAAGKAVTAFLPHAANAPYDCRNLICTYLFGRNESKCNTWVHAKKVLEMKVQYLGNVYYFGSPENIYPTLTGEGKLIKAD